MVIAPHSIKLSVRIWQPMLIGHPKDPLKFTGYSQEQNMLPQAMFIALELGFDKNVRIPLPQLSEFLVRLGKASGWFPRKQEVQRSAAPSFCAVLPPILSLCAHPPHRASCSPSSCLSLGRSSVPGVMLLLPVCYSSYEKNQLPGSSSHFTGCVGPRKLSALLT